MVCVIGFLGNGETVGVGGEKKIHGRVLEVRNWETLTEENLTFHCHTLLE